MKLPPARVVVCVAAALLTSCRRAPAPSPNEATEVSHRSGAPGTAGLSSSPPAPTRPAPEAPEPEGLFVDVAPGAGLDFVHWNGMTGALYFVEPVGSGGALFDADGDGDLDVVLVQGNLLGQGRPSGAEPGKALAPVFPPPPRSGARLFRNDLEGDAQGRSRLGFTDVTAQSGLRAEGYGMGVATGDFDGDGRIDLYLTNYGSNQLWRNVSADGIIAFTDVTAAAGVDDPRWSTSASFADLDADGRLDLFVANYVDFRLERHKLCRSPGGRPDYCGPQSYSGEVDRLFRNRGDGTFEDVTGPAGLRSSPSSGLGVVAADLDLDGRIDVYVANDLNPNFLWSNRGTPLSFQDVALVSGCAVSSMGRSQASMGLVAADFDNDGDDDLFMTHLSADSNTLYVNDGAGLYDDGSTTSGLGPASLAATGFGTVAIDVDNDGWLDLMVANGGVRVIEEQARAGKPYPLAQANQLLWNRGDGRFEDASDRAGKEFSRLEVSRGVAVGDVDNDGHSDLLVTNNSGPARLLHNRSHDGNAWVGLRVLTGAGSDALGTRVRVSRGDGTFLWRRLATDGSYLSASDPRVLVGLGPRREAVTARAYWPGGEVEEWAALDTGRYHDLIAGTGRRVPPAQTSP